MLTDSKYVPMIRELETCCIMQIGVFCEDTAGFCRPGHDYAMILILY